MGEPKSLQKTKKERFAYILVSDVHQEDGGVYSAWLPSHETLESLETMKATLSRPWENSSS